MSEYMNQPQSMLEIKDKLISKINDLEQEVKTVYFELVIPNWGRELHGFLETLYGYMMVCFSKIDLFSAYWKGDGSHQPQRMIDFIEKYIWSSREAAFVAVQIWRHKLMHTAEPRTVVDKQSGQSYRWLLHWWNELPLNQHATFQDATDPKILNLGLVYLISDLRSGLEKYLGDLSHDSVLQDNYRKFECELASRKYRTHVNHQPAPS